MHIPPTRELASWRRLFPFHAHREAAGIMPRRMRFVERAEFTALCAASRSVAEVIKTLGWRTGGGAYRRVRWLIQHYEVDVPTGPGRAGRKGLPAGGRPFREQPLEVILTNGSGHTNAHSLKKRLTRGNVIPYVCADCGNPGHWNDRELRLELDHVDGNRRNWSRENLQFRCPNCHSQTPNYCKRKSARITASVARVPKVVDGAGLGPAG